MWMMCGANCTHTTRPTTDRTHTHVNSIMYARVSNLDPAGVSGRICREIAMCLDDLGGRRGMGRVGVVGFFVCSARLIVALARNCMLVGPWIWPWAHPWGCNHVCIKCMSWAEWCSPASWVHCAWDASSFFLDPSAANGQRELMLVSTRMTCYLLLGRRVGLFCWARRPSCHVRRLMTPCPSPLSSV